MCTQSQPAIAGAAEQQDGYQMIESLEVQNYRCFKDLQLKNLGRVNVIVGDNGSGKTALLESIFLAGGLGPEIYLRTRAWRGAGERFQVSIDRDQYEGLWRELFYSLDQNNGVMIRFKDSESGDRQLRIYYEFNETRLMPVDYKARSAYESGDIHPITFEWRTEEGEPQKATVDVTPQGVMQFPQIKNLYPIMFFSTATTFAPEENAKRFSFLSRRNRQESVTQIIRSLFPMVKDLSVEIVAGVVGVYATVDYLDEKIAVGSLSAGLAKYLAILFGIAAYPKGVVVIDEIENGFFYQKYADVWRGITALASEHDTQLFVSTHSIECLQAALPVVAENPTAFTLLRTERRDDHCVVKPFAGKDLLAGLQQRIEFR